MPFDSENTFMRILSDGELLQIYTTHSVRHFPEAERKPVSSLQRMTTEGIYKGFGLYTGETQELICYAFFVVLPGRRNILLDYFAVMEDYRSHGVGSLFLQRVKRDSLNLDGLLLDGLLIEVEDPDFAGTGEDLRIRNRRIVFYEKNGAADTGIRAQVFGVSYRVLYLSILERPAHSVLFTDFNDMYRRMITGKKFEAHVNIR